MKKALILRGSTCLGDNVIISWVPKVLKEERKFDYVAIASWEKPKAIFENNPYVDEIISLEPIAQNELKEQLDKWSKEYELFDFRYTLEMNFFSYSSSNTYSQEVLRNRAGNRNYYLDSLKYYNLSGQKGDLYISGKEQLQVKNGRKKIGWHIQGSSQNKVLIYAAAYINHLKDNYPEIDHYLLGTEKTPLPIKGSVIDLRGKQTIRQDIAIVSIFDLVIGPESFFTHVAGALDVPCLMFASHSKPENAISTFKNAYAIEPRCECYPCYLIINQWRELTDLKKRSKAREVEKNCMQFDKNDNTHGLGFKCCLNIDHEKVINKILFILENKK